MKGEQTKQAIIEGVYRLSAEVGLESLTTKRLASGCGIAEGTIYRYFTTKEELLKTCYLAINTELDGALSAAFQKDGSMEDVLRRMWNSYLDYMAAHRDRVSFYDRFRHSSYMDRVTIEEQTVSFPFMSWFIVSRLKASGVPLTRDNQAVIWAIVIESAIALALHAAGDGVLGEEPREQTFQILLRALMQGNER